LWQSWYQPQEQQNAGSRANGTGMDRELGFDLLTQVDIGGYFGDHYSNPTKEFGFLRTAKRRGERSL
jgi:hypothetical protein